jgi:adenylate kinase
MDGYPRTLAQATSFDLVLCNQSLPLHAVILLVVDGVEIIRRLSGRWICPNSSCGATYHLAKKPPQVAGKCDLCGTPLIQREDDREETIRHRLHIHQLNTAELIPYYRAQNLLHELPGDGDIETVFAAIAQVVSPAAKTSTSGT